MHAPKSGLVTPLKRGKIHDYMIYYYSTVYFSKNNYARLEHGTCIRNPVNVTIKRIDVFFFRAHLVIFSLSLYAGSLVRELSVKRTQNRMKTSSNITIQAGTEKYLFLYLYYVCSFFP